MNPTIYQVTSASAPVLVAAPNVQATERIIQNSPASPAFYVAYGSDASATLYTAIIAPGGLFRTSYTGIIYGYCSGTGTVSVTEVSG